MEKLYDIGGCLSAILGVIGIAVSIVGMAMGRTFPPLNANDHSLETLCEELEHEFNFQSALNDNITSITFSLIIFAKKRCWLYQIAYYSLSSISVIGGILVSTVYFYETFTKQIGLIGFFILLSTLLMLFIRPMEKYQRARKNYAFLKKTERDYKCIDETQKAICFLRKKLNEYDKTTMSD